MSAATAAGSTAGDRLAWRQDSCCVHSPRRDGWHVDGEWHAVHAPSRGTRKKLGALRSLLSPSLFAHTHTNNLHFSRTSATHTAHGTYHCRCSCTTEAALLECHFKRLCCPNEVGCLVTQQEFPQLTASSFITRTGSAAPPNYEAPGWPSLYWPLPLSASQPYYLYDPDDIWRFTLIWTALFFGAMHMVVALWTCIVQWRNWKVIWITPLVYAIIGGIEGLIAGSIVGGL